MAGMAAYLGEATPAGAVEGLVREAYGIESEVYGKERAAKSERQSGGPASRSPKPRWTATRRC